MSIPRSRIGLFFIAAALWMTAACDSDESVMSPAADAVPPEIVISVAPTTGRATEPVTLEWKASDDVGLETVSVAWGVPGSAQTLRATGRSLEGSFTNVYDRLGSFTVHVSATDEAGNTGAADHAITIGSPAPSAPTRVTVVVDGSTATIGWQPGAWSTSQQVVVACAGGIGAERVLTLAGSEREIDVDDLSWEATCEAVVIAVNDAGQAESAAVPFAVGPPIPPWLFRFSSAIADSTCLEVVWEHGPHPAGTYDVVVTGDTEAESFTESLSADAGPPFDMQQARFCASDYPVVDGMSYTAQVFGRFGEGAYGSNARDWTVDFQPTYSVIGTWSMDLPLWSPFDEQVRPRGRQTLELVEADGTITGTWASYDAEGAPLESGSVAGTWSGTSVDLALAVSDGDVRYWVGGSFAGADGIAGSMWYALGFSQPVFYQRD